MCGKPLDQFDCIYQNSQTFKVYDHFQPERTELCNKCMLNEDKQCSEISIPKAVLGGVRGLKRGCLPGLGSLGPVVCSPAVGGLLLCLGSTLPCVFGVLALEMPPCLAAAARSAPRANFIPRNNGGRRMGTVKLWKSPQYSHHVTPTSGRCPDTGPLVSGHFSPFGWRSCQCLSSAFPLQPP